MEVPPSTVYRIERVHKQPTFKPDLDTIEKWVRVSANASLSAFFLQLEQGDEGLHTVEASGHNSPSDLSTGGDSGALEFDTEDRITARVLRRLSRELAKSLERDARTRPADYRLPANPRPLAAERRPRTGKSGDGHVPTKTQKRPSVRRRR